MSSQRRNCNKMALSFNIKKKQMGFFPIKYEDSYKLNQKKKLRWAKENTLISSIFNFN
jgi:hypothetical protein